MFETIRLQVVLLEALSIFLTKLKGIFHFPVRLVYGRQKKRTVYFESKKGAD
jgi:hypothetical protein